MPAKIDLTGQRFGIRTVLGPAPTPSHIKTRIRRFWLVRCDCGNEAIRSRANVLKNYSCGCHSRAATGKRLRKPHGEASKNSLFIRYKWNAKSRNIAFDLTLNQCEKLWQADCHYCGSPPSQMAKNDARRFNGGYVYNGIDRKDNDIGYLLENCLSCCKACNYLKRDHPYEDFVAHIRRISRRLENTWQLSLEARQV